MTYSKPVFPQTYGRSIEIHSTTGVQLGKTVAELSYDVGDPDKKDGYFLKATVLLTDQKGDPFDAYTAIVENDLTITETRNNKGLFGLKDCKVTIGKKVCTKYFEIAFELLNIMSGEYRVNSGSAWIEPIAPFLSELIKVSDLIDGDRHVELDEIIGVFAYCHDLDNAGSVIKGSKFLGYCQQFAAIAATVKTIKTTEKTTPIDAGGTAA